MATPTKEKMMTKKREDDDETGNSKEEDNEGKAENNKDENSGDNNGDGSGSGNKDRYDKNNVKWVECQACLSRGVIGTAYPDCSFDNLFIYLSYWTYLCRRNNNSSLEGSTF